LRSLHEVEAWREPFLRVSCNVSYGWYPGANLKALTFLLSLLSFVSTTAFTQSFTVDQVMSSPFPSQLTSARQAEIVGWVFNNKGADNVWIATPPDYVGRQITRYSGDDGQRIASLKITPDGRTVLYARGSELNSAGRSANPLSLPGQPKQQVWAAEVEIQSNLEIKLIKPKSKGKFEED